MCGEYGSTWKQRPHFHAIIFNADAETIPLAWTKKNGDIIGNIHIGSVSNDSIAYTAKYIDKDKQIKDGDYRTKEFSRSSNGLGKGYLTDAVKKYHKADPKHNFVLVNGYKKRLPRYYRDKIFTEEEKEMQIKEFAEEREKELVNLEYELMNHVTAEQGDVTEREREEKAAIYAKFYQRLKKRNYD